MLADPAGVAVALITGTEPGLDPALAEGVVMRVADGRAMRRKLARALSQRPAVLADGRSPAPRVVGDLLIALRKAGAMVICAPVCATCGKELRTLQRRGEDWYCSVCIRRPGRCSACGRERIIRECQKDCAGGDRRECFRRSHGVTRIRGRSK